MNIRVGMLTIVIISAIAGAVVFPRSNNAPELQVAAIAPQLLPLAERKISLIEPVEGFLTRATIKHYGTYITPDTSPVQGDKFTGYHTGVDAEFTDFTGDVPVRAIADGTFVTREWVKGYGGVVVINHIIDGIPTFALYGHLDPAGFLPQNTTEVKAGDIIGILGDGHSHETDGTRKHLHFSLYRGDKIDYRGYVSTEIELKPWLDPLKFF